MDIVEVLMSSPDPFYRIEADNIIGMGRKKQGGENIKMN